MREFIVIFIIVGVVLSTAGCTKIKQQIQGKTSTENKSVNKVKGVTLAKAILHPKPYKFTFTKDPFMPLLGKVFSSGEATDINATGNLRVIGIVMLGDNSVALLESSLETGAFKKGDKIGNYTVIKIDKDRVVLAKGKNKMILKLGGENE